MPTTKPSQSELEILQALWELGVGTVRDIHTNITRFRKVGYTTTLKQVQRMQAKGMVEKVSDESRSHTFKALVPPQRTRNELVDRLVKTAFDNSPNALIIHALGYKKINKSEIKEIRQMLDDMEPED